MKDLVWSWLCGQRVREGFLRWSLGDSPHADAGSAGGEDPKRSLAVLCIRYFIIIIRTEEKGLAKLKGN